MKKRTIITMVLAGFLGLANAQNSSNAEGHVQSATAISRYLNSTSRSLKNSRGRVNSIARHDMECPCSENSITCGGGSPCVLPSTYYTLVVQFLVGIDTENKDITELFGIVRTHGKRIEAAS